MALNWNQAELPSGFFTLRDAITGERAQIDVDGVSMSFLDLAWSPDGSGFYIAAISVRGTALLHVDLQGEAHVLYEDQAGGGLNSVTPSPDGRHLAFRRGVSESNIWMIEGF